MSHRKRVALAIIAWLLFAFLMGVRQDLPAPWMRVAAAVVAALSLWVSFGIVRQIVQERRS